MTEDMCWSGFDERRSATLPLGKGWGWVMGGATTEACTYVFC